MDSEIGSIDITADASIQSFSFRVNSALRSTSNAADLGASGFQSFSLRVNNAIRSYNVADLGASDQFQNFSSRVNNALRSINVADLGASEFQNFSSRVDNAMRSTNIADLGASEFRNFSSRVDNALRSINEAAGTELEKMNLGESRFQSFASTADNAIRSTNNALSSPQVIISNATGHVERYRLFTLAEIEAATNNFSPENKIGAYFVYRGVLADGREVAIKTKKKKKKKKRGYDDEFLSFSLIHMYLSHLCHENLVGLVGFCDVKDDKRLIGMYMYMKNGSLQDHLEDVNGSSVLNSWKMRIKIALDVARGIQYFHEYVGDFISHGHINSSNILFDATWTARVQIRLDVSETRRVDVFGLGILVLELLTGKSTIFKDGRFGDTPLRLTDLEEPTILPGESVTIELDQRVGPPDLNEAKALKMVANTAMRCVKMALESSDIVASLKVALTACDSSQGSFSNGVGEPEELNLTELVATTNNFSPYNKICGFVYLDP